MIRRKSVLAAVIAAVLLAVAPGGTALGSSETTSRAASAAAAATPGCGKTPTLRSGTHTIQSSGQTRSFILRIPDNYDNTNPYRLIFGFHWLGGTANDVDSGGSSGYTWSYYGLRQLANNTAIFVAPQGLNNGWANSGGQDLTFVDDMISLIEADLCVDTTQRFAGGFSYGGGMSYALACARATVFRAVAVYAGAQLSGCSGGTQPIAYIGLHGLRDNVLNISQGRSLRDTFVRNNGCTPQNPPEPAQGSLTHVVTAYSGCRSGYPVVWAAFDGGHTPGPVDGSTADDGARTWTKAVVWDFFNQFQSTDDTTPPTSPGTPAVSNVTATSATLTWTASTDQGGSGLAGYNVYREQGATDPLLGQSTTNSITLTGLTADTEYQVYVRARDGAGNLSANSASVTFTTTSTGGDTTPPTAPSGLTASGTTADGTNLSWAASTDDVGVAGYDILRAPGATGGTFAQVGTSATTSYSDTGLTPSTTYRYQVRARDAAGNLSPVSDTVQVTTSGTSTGACSATPTVQTQWGTGYVIQPLTITNTSTSTITDWTVAFTLPAGHTLTGSWNATITTSGQTVTARSVSFNGTLAPGATTSFGFQATRPDGDTALPSGYTCTSG
ncbi:cellulose binding domain-containing protein [Nonomuraea sp. NPDC049649]|uniref:cellulose binding domain-containing protein n=1 Tax=Nonomuraea sp. NPDC049649 TaxID=3155776 RepID=UPI00343D4D82